MPEHVTRKVTMIVEVTVAGPESAAEAIRLAEGAITLPGPDRPIAIRDVKVTSVLAMRQ